MNSETSINARTKMRVMMTAFLIGIPFIFNLFRLSSPLSLVTLAFIIFYATFIIHTLFSVNTFSRIMKKSIVQSFFDFALIGNYIAISFFLTQSTKAFILLFFLFIFAALKYYYAKERKTYQKIFHRKISYECGGIVISSVCVVLSAQGFETYAAIAWMILFLVVTLHLSFIKPLYRIHF